MRRPGVSCFLIGYVSKSAQALQTALNSGWSQPVAMETGLGMREDTGGHLDFDPGSPQTAQADKESVVFRVGDLYLSTDSVELQQGGFVLRSHAATDYIRVELAPGAALPDWSFTDLKAAQESLKSYAGKYVLLDFWYPSCVPCRSDFEELKSVLQFGFSSVISKSWVSSVIQMTRERGS